MNEFEFIDRIKEEKKLPGHLSQPEAAKLMDSIDVSPKLCDKRFKWFGIYFERSAEAAFLAVRDKALLETIDGTGTRAQETANLNWSDVDFRARLYPRERWQGTARPDRTDYRDRHGSALKLGYRVPKRSLRPSRPDRTRYT